MKFIVSQILNFLVRSKVIESNSDELDYYRYGIEISISSILNVVLILILGTVTRHFIESIVFLTVFISMRSFAGGFHADTYVRCNLIMCTSFLIETVLYELVKKQINIVLAVVLTAVFLMVIIVFSPVENPNKPITEIQKKRFKVISILLWILFAVIGVILIHKKICVGTMIVLTLALVSIMIIAAKVKERRNCYEKNNRKDNQNIHRTYG